MQCMQYFLFMLYLIINPANYCQNTSGQCHGVMSLHLLYNYNVVTLYDNIPVNVVFDAEH